MEEASDEELMVRVAAGDQGAFRTLSRRHLTRSLSLARRITGNPADAEEIVQEALLRVWINAPRWRPTAAFRTWFYRVVFNLCLNSKRRRPFAPLEDAGDPVDPAPNAAGQIERREGDDAIAAAVAALPDRQRAAIVLTYHEGLSNGETAAVLDTSVGGVETLLVRAKRALRISLGPQIATISRDEF
jgi:RNA polymerase sigma-70 factor (ECF subfamily)